MKLLKLALYAGLTAYGVSYLVRKRRTIDLTGRLVLITGGSRGLGLALAREFALEGARLALLARDERELQSARRLLAPADVGVYPCDVTDPAQIRDVVSQVRRDMGDIDVLVNNAGAMTVGPESAMTDGDYDLALRTNYLAPLAFIRTLLPFMRERQAGRIVNIASIGGKLPIPHQSAYCASKHALVGLSESLRTELTSQDIYVLTVCPGFIDNGAPVNVVFKGDAKEEFAWFSGAANSSAAIDPVTLARKIVKATRQGDAELIYPRFAWAQQALHNLAPGVSTELSTSLAQHALPSGTSTNRTPTKGIRLAAADPVQGTRMVIANSQGTST